MLYDGLGNNRSPIRRNHSIAQKHGRIMNSATTPTNRLTQQLNFILEIDRLKGVMRRSMLVSGDRYENSAEHSWHVALMAVLLSEHSNEPVDVLHIVKMLLVHDIVEIDAGDTYAYDESGKQSQAEREQAAAERLFGLLPADQANEMKAAFFEFDARETAEAKMANAVDRLMPLLHNYYSQGKEWRKHGITREQVIQRIGPVVEGSEALWAFAEEIIDRSVEEGYIRG
jgi:putative hydrolase of HD superfamily